MSITVMSSILEAEFPKYLEDGEGGRVKGSTAKFVLVVIANHANPEGTNTYPGLARLKKETAFSRYEVIRAIKALKYSGLLLASKGTSKLGTNEYSIVLDALVNPIDQSTPLTRVVNPIDRGSQSDRLGVVNPVDPNRTLTVNEPLINREILSFEEQEQIQDLPSKEEASELISTSKPEEEEAALTTDDTLATRQEVVELIEQELRINISPKNWDEFVKLPLRDGRAYTLRFTKLMNTKGGDPSYWHPAEFIKLWPQVKTIPLEPAETPAFDKWDDPTIEWAKTLEI